MSSLRKCKQNLIKRHLYFSLDFDEIEQIKFDFASYSCNYGRQCETQFCLLENNSLCKINQYVELNCNYKEIYLIL